MNVNEILKQYSIGEMSLEDANKNLYEILAPFHLDPVRNVLTDEEIQSGTAGLLDTGTGSMDKVQVKDGHTVNFDSGDMHAFVYLGGKTYEVHGTELVEI